MAKPGMLTNWVTFAMANYMANDFSGALDTVGSMFKFENENTTIKPNEKNALRLLEARCLEKLGRDADALKGLKKHKKVILDKV